MQPVESLMLRVADTCNRLRLEYYVTGSIAAMFWGEPRGTLDVDIVVELPGWNVNAFCDAFPPPDYYVEPEAAHQAIQHDSQFNIIDLTAGVKADIIVFKDDPFSESRLTRARLVEFGAAKVRVATPEDVILKKLDFYRQGGSDKHIRDIGGIIKVSGSLLDLSYIRSWALRIGVKAQWEEVCRQLGREP